MRKIDHIGVSSIDVQMCLVDLNRALEDRGIPEQDVISVQYLWHEKPIKISPPIGSEDKAWVSLVAFYWSD